MIIKGTKSLEPGYIYAPYISVTTTNPCAEIPLGNYETTTLYNDYFEKERVRKNRNEIIDGLLKDI